MGTIMLMLISSLPLMTLFAPFFGIYELGEYAAEQLPTVLEPVTESLEFVFGAVENFVYTIFNW